MTIKDTGIALALMCLWGLNFSAIKLGANETDPILLTALRFTFAVLPAVFFVKRPKGVSKFLVLYGLVFGLGVWGMMIWSVNLGVSAGMAPLMMNMSLISSLVLGYLVFNESMTSYKVMGAVLAIGGLVISLMLGDGSFPLAALPLTLIAALSWSFLSVIF